MSNFKTFPIYFKFTREQRAGISLLSAIIIIVQLVCFYADFNLPEKNSRKKEQWMSLQSKIDSLKLLKDNDKPKVYNFLIQISSQIIKAITLECLLRKLTGF